MIEKTRLSALLNEALKDSPADETELVVWSGTNSLTRFAESRVHQNVHEENAVVTARVAVGKRLGVVMTNRLKPAELRAALTRATEIAKASPEDPDFPGFPKSDPAPAVDTFSEATAAMSPMQRAEAVNRAVDIAAKKKTTLSGAYRVSAFRAAVVNTSGTEQMYDGTDAFLSVFATDANKVNGATAAYARGIEGIDVARTAQLAVDKCVAGANPVSVDYEPMDIVVEPRAIAEVLSWLNFTAFGAKQVHENMSFMAGRFGEKVMGDNITLVDDGFDPSGVPVPFDYEGVTKRPVTIIERGIARSPVYDSITAAKDGVESTGHAGMAAYRGGPSCSNLFVLPGDRTKEELIGMVDRGIFVSNFHYVNGFLDTRRALFTGMTRAGTYLIENGRIARAVKNMRWTDSMMRVFSEVAGMTKERETIGASWGAIGSVTSPTMLVRGFKFTGATDF
jgi:PmbA protein